MGKKGRKGGHKGTGSSGGGSSGGGGDGGSGVRELPPTPAANTTRPATAPAASPVEEFPLPGADSKKKKKRGGRGQHQEAQDSQQQTSGQPPQSLPDKPRPESRQEETLKSPISPQGSDFPSLGQQSPAKVPPQTPVARAPWSTPSQGVIAAPPGQNDKTQGVGMGGSQSPPQPSFWAQRQQQQQSKQPTRQQSRQDEGSQQPQSQSQSQSGSPPAEPVPTPQQQPQRQAAAIPKSPISEMIGEVKSIGLNVQIPRRSQRKKAEKKGEKIIVETNHVALRIKNPNMEVFHYDVSISPEKPYRFYRPAMNAIQRKCYPNRHPAFDGKKNLYSYPELPLNGKELCETVSIYDEERQANKDVTVTIKYANTVDISVINDYMRNGSSCSVPQDAIQALDIVLRQPAANKFVTVGRSFFTQPSGRVISLGDGLDLWYGFFQSAIIGWKPYLNIDVAHKGFPAPNPCLKVICDIAQCSLKELEHPNFQLSSLQQKTFLEHMKNLKVVCEVPQNNMKRTYKVIGISECPRRNRFIMEDKVTKCKQEMTVEQYFLNMYKYRLKYPHLSCLKAGSTEKPVSLPVELCTIISGQITMKKMNEGQTRTMVKEAAVGTDKRKAKILKSMEEVKYNEHRCLKEFGLSVADTFTKVEARILPSPTIDYKDRNKQMIVKVPVEKGVWKLFNNKFLNGADLMKWAILSTNRRIRDDEMKVLGDGLTDHGRQCGLNIAPPLEMVSFDNQNKIEDYFRRCEKEGVKLLVVILPEKGVSYAAVKKLAELQVGILTQCLKSNTVQRRLNQATFVNILQKINAKLNGINHNITSQIWPDFFKRPVMVVGADVTHPAPDQAYVPSIAAVAASHDPKAFKYNMIWKLQPPRVEVISDLQNIMIEQLKFFYRSTRQKPERILFYRDGVSEGQFRVILDVELRAIRQACRSLQADYEPPITFLVVQKRHHTRFFPAPKDADGGNKNVPAGTVVDSEITHPTELDFYLVSHASIQGTARPTKYHLLWDDADMSEQALEEITYYLCHLFTRCTRSVSYPAPTYYAHLAAFRARSYTEADGNQPMNLDDLDKEQSKRKVMDKIVRNNPMFFV